MRPKLDPEEIGLLRGYALAVLPSQEYGRFCVLLDIVRFSLNKAAVQLAASSLSPIIARIQGDIRRKLEQVSLPSESNVCQVEE